MNLFDKNYQFSVRDSEWTMKTFENRLKTNPTQCDVR